MRVLRSVSVVFFAMLLVVGAGGAPGVLAQGDTAAEPPGNAVQAGTGTLTVHWRICTEIPINGDWYGSCHDTPQRSHQIWIVSTPDQQRISQPADAAGDAIFVLAPGTYQVEEVPGDFVDDSLLFCSTLEAPGVRVASPIMIGAGENYLCDYYVVPSNARGDVTTPTPVPAGVPQPYPAAIYYGDCAPGAFVDPIMELKPVARPNGAASGSVDAVPVSLSFTHGFVKIDALLNDQTVIAVFDPANPESLVACGVIGGVPDSNGAFAVGLLPSQGSGLTGVAYLRPGTNDSLSVTVYLVATAS